MFSCFCGLSFTVFAANESVMRISKRQMKVGEEVTVTVYIDADVNSEVKDSEQVFTMEFELNYDKECLELSAAAP